MFGAGGIQERNHVMKHPIKPPKTGPSAATVLILALLLLMVAAYVLYQVVDNL